MKTRSVFRALRHRPFALVWTGQSISLLGDRVYQVALAWWVLEKTSSALVMGTVLVLSVVPMLVFLLLGGALVDRLPRIRLMFVSDLVRAAVMAVTSVLAFSGRLEIWHIYALSLVFGAMDAFFQPAYRVAVPEMAPEEDLTSANSLGSFSRQLAGIAGPAAGALVVALGGTSLAFALDGLSFVLSLLCLLPLLNRRERVQPVECPSSVWADVREGLGAVFASPWLWVTIGVAGISNVTYAGPMETALPYLIKEYRHESVQVLGLYYSAASVGSLVAAAGMGFIPRLRRRGLLLYVTWMLVGLMVVVIGLPQLPTPGLIAASFVNGALNTVLGLTWLNTLQEKVPSNLLGRVSSVDYLGSYLLLPIGLALGGWATERFGVVAVFVVGGALQTLLVALGLLHPQVRKLD